MAKSNNESIMSNEQYIIGMRKWKWVLKKWNILCILKMKKKILKVVMWNVKMCNEK